MINKEDGFTLIELMIAVMILIVITVPLINSFALGVKASSGSSQDVTNSADAQTLGYFFDIDVSSAETVSPTSGSCGGTGSVLELTWTDGGAVVVAYRAVTDAARQAELQLSTAVYRLERVQCSGGTSTVTIIGRTLLSAPTVTCDAATCAASSTPRRVQMSVQERSTQESDLLSTTTFSFGVTAVRKVTP